MKNERKRIIAGIKEIVYSRTYADIFNLAFADLSAAPDFLSKEIRGYLNYFGFFSDYIYSSRDKQRLLATIFCNSVDYVLVNMNPFDSFTIKFNM